MKAQLHHVALYVASLDWYVRFFQQLFGMEIRKSAGTAPNRKIWFAGGIQLNECQDTPPPGGACDHISLAVSNVDGAKQAALVAGCKTLPEGENWFALPNGVKIELMRISHCP